MLAGNGGATGGLIRCWQCAGGGQAMNFFELISGAKRKKQQIERFVVKLINHAQIIENNSEQKRSEKRTPLAISIQVTPCSEDGQPDAQAAFNAVSRDITLDGIAFVCSRQFQPQQLLVLTMECDNEPSDILSEVLHCTPLGRDLFLTGCRFRQRLGV